jgi:hypothetical protein
MSLIEMRSDTSRTDWTRSRTRRLTWLCKATTIAACGTMTARARTPSRGWLAKMKPITLICVPSCKSGEAMAPPAKAPTVSASAASIATSVPRVGTSAAPRVAAT